SAAIAGQISTSEIEVDDYVSNGGRTTIGPLWPNGKSIGACWVSSNYTARYAGKAKAATPVTLNGASHEHMTIQYFDGEQQNRRFYGFQANLIQTNGSLSLVELWNPGSGGSGGASAGRWWLDLAACAEPSTPALCVGKPAALFLDVKTTRMLTT